MLWRQERSNPKNYESADKATEHLNNKQVVGKWTTYKCSISSWDRTLAIEGGCWRKSLLVRVIGYKCRLCCLILQYIYSWYITLNTVILSLLRRFHTLTIFSSDPNITHRLFFVILILFMEDVGLWGIFLKFFEQAPFSYSLVYRSWDN